MIPLMMAPVVVVAKPAMATVVGKLGLAIVEGIAEKGLFAVGKKLCERRSRSKRLKGFAKSTLYGTAAGMVLAISFALGRSSVVGGMEE